MEASVSSAFFRRLRIRRFIIVSDILEEKVERQPRIKTINSIHGTSRAGKTLPLRYG